MCLVLDLDGIREVLSAREAATFSGFRYIRVGISQVKVYEKIGNSVIKVFRTDAVSY